MKQRYRVFRRENGIYYYLDVLTKRRHSLETASPETARRLINAKNEACVQPAINLQIAKAYLAAADSNFVKRTWREVMADFVKVKTGSNRTRSERAVFDKAFDSIRDLQLLETRAEHFLRVLESGKISTNNYLRRFHNLAVDMGWLPWPVMPKRQWPPNGPVGAWGSLASRFILTAMLGRNVPNAPVRMARLECACLVQNRDK